MSSRSSVAAIMTLATSLYACAQVSARFGSPLACPRNCFKVASRLPPNHCCNAQSQREVTVITAQLLRKGHHIVELGEVSRPQGTGRPPGCRAAPTSGSKTSSAAQGSSRSRCE